MNNTVYDKWKPIIIYILKNYKTIKECEEIRQADILEGCNYELDQTGIFGSRTGNPTEQKAIRLSEENDELRIIKIIDIVLCNHNNTFAVKCICEKFNLTKKKGDDVRYMDMVSEKTYYRYQREVIEEIAKRLEKNDSKVTVISNLNVV